MQLVVDKIARSFGRQFVAVYAALLPGDSDDA